MNITIKDHDDKIKNQAISAGFVSVEQYITQLLDLDAERLAIEEGMRAVEEGRGSPAEEVYARIRKKLYLK